MTAYGPWLTVLRMNALAVLVGVLPGLAGLASAPPDVPDDDAAIEIAKQAFTDAVSSEIGEARLVACAIDEYDSIQCYGLVNGGTLDDPSTLVIQAGWIDDDGGFFALSEPTPISLTRDDEDEATNSPDDLRQLAEDYLTTFEFEEAAGLFGHVENPRCETPDSTEEGEVFACRFDMVTNENVFVMEARFRVTETGDIAAIHVDFTGSG